MIELRWVTPDGVRMKLQQRTWDRVNGWSKWENVPVEYDSYAFDGDDPDDTVFPR